MVLEDGATVKFTPLPLLPILVPRLETVYQFIVLPEEVAFKKLNEPGQIAAGVALTRVGAAGKLTTVTSLLTRELMHP